MMKKSILALLVVLLVAPVLTARQYISTGKATDLRFYLSSDLDLDDPRFQNRPIFGRVRHTYVPPEILKEKPNETIIMNSDGFELVNISPGNNAQSETWIAMNPTNPLNLIATSNDNRYMTGDYRMSSWATTDGGRTWHHANTPPNRGYLFDIMPGGSMTIFDPGITFDTKGNAYYSYGFTQINRDQQTPDDNGVFLAKSTDGGLSWGGDFNGDPIGIAAAEIGNVPGQPFHDRYTIASDLNENSPYKDYIYLAWQKFQANNNQILLGISPNQGSDWTSVVPLFTGNNTQSPVPSVGPNGEVYVIWQNRNRDNHSTQAVFRRSDNGGATWTNSAVAMNVYTIGEIDPDVNLSRYIMTNKQNIRVSSYTAISVDRTEVGSPTRGRVYVVMAGREAPNGDYGVYITWSDNKGQTWTPKKRVDDAIRRNDMFFPAIDVDNTNGTVAIFYYSSQNDPNNIGVDAYIAVSRDMGETFTNIRLTPESVYLSHPGTVSQQDVQGSNVYWGDYAHIVAHGGKIYPLWWWPTGSNYHYGTLDLFTALISSKPRPPINFDAKSIVNNQDISIRLTWDNPTKDLLGGELGDFSLELFKEWQKIADLDKNTTEYIDNSNLIDGNLYHYEIRVKNSNNEYSVFAKKSIFAGGAVTPNPPVDVVAKPHQNGVMIEWTNPSTSVDGSDIRNLERIDIYKDNLLVESVDKSSISAGTTTKHVLNLPTKEFFTFKLKAVTSRNDVETESNFSQEAFSYSGQLFLSFVENFDSEQDMIPFHNIDGNWGITTQTHASAPYSFNQSPNEFYKRDARNRMVFAPTIVDENRKTLHFNLIAKIHQSDYGSVYISNDFGKSFTEVIRFDENTRPDNFKHSTLEACSFVRISYNLPEYIGDTIYVMLGLTANALIEDWGMFIDDIVIDNQVGVEDRYNPVYQSLTHNVSPNPTTGKANLDLLVPISGNLSIDLYDQLGNKVAQIANEHRNVGNVSYSVSLDNLPAAVYYIRINLNSFTKTVPIIKQ